ncbi:MAG: choice-of-anchor D domain-containing protein, partial [Thermoanaerobaculia bacterium]
MSVLRQCGVVIAVALLLGLLPANGAELTERVQVHQEFSVEHPVGWSVRQIANTQQIFAASAEAIDRGEVVLEDIARVVIHTEQRTDRAEALLRLKQIEAESDTPSSFVQIAGWPALQRVQLMEKPHAGKRGDPRPERPMQLVATTAIAVDSLIVRLEAVLPSDATPEAIGEVLMLGESVNTLAVGDPDAAQQEVDRLNSEPVLRTLGLGRRTKGDRVPLDRPPPEPEAVLIAGAPLRVTNQGGIDAELEITVSTDGRDIVIGSNGNYFVSNDAGQTFGTSAGISGNDPSLGYGASGTFWAANIGGACNTAILASTNNGQSFTPTTSAYTCPNAVPTPGMGGCVQDPQCGAGFPDQEHIAADRYNPAPGGDQVYSAWRSLWSNVGVGIVCSQDSGATWTNAIFTLGDFPRITVGQDGRVYVAYRQGNNIQLWRLSSCATGLAPSAPVVVVTGNPQVPCPVPGLNRCNDGNNLSSPTVAVDDTNANHIFVSYAVNTLPNNENVLLQDSLDGGANWGSCRSACGFPLPGDSLTPCTPGGAACPAGGEVCCPNAVQVSSGILGRRFMPWVCSVGGEAYVTWYDRRNATAADNSLTDFFAGNAERDGFALNAGDEIQYTPVSDSHCGPPSTNWPGSAPRNSNDSESCSQQPQFAGQCAAGTCMATCGTPTGGDSNAVCNPGGAACPGAEQCCVTRTGTRCDFSASGTTACNTTTIGLAGGQCSATQFCACAGGSPPKHGDYNGNACMAGRLYSTWVSATSPPAIAPPSTSIDIFFSEKVVCCVPQIQVPAPVDFGLACGDGSQKETLEVCNTGKEELVVDAITSSSGDFAVTEPSSGWGVDISPDFCFPFEVTYTPSGPGDQSATLTIPTNDPVNPTVEVAVTATSGVAEIDTFIANSGNFGDVCTDEQKDLNLTIQNNGSCDLEIDSVSLSGGNAADFDLPDGSLAGTIIESGNSLLIPVRFSPSNFTTSNPRTTNVIVASSTSGGDSLPDESTPLQGTSPPPDIQAAIAQLGDFGGVCKTE